MSLLLHRRAIARAVAGDLPRGAEDRLRAHLGHCRACRAFYDQLAHAASGVALSGGGGARRADARERERLERALPRDTGTGGAGSSGPVGQRPARGRWLLAGLALAPAAALLLWLRHPAPSLPPPAGSAPELGWRGAQTDATAAGPTLVVYASRRAGEGGHAPLRLVGEFPGSGTVRVSRSDYLQFGVRGLATPALVSIVADGHGHGGVVHVFLPRAGAPAPVAAPSPGPSTIGPSFDLARAPAAGRYTVRARFAPAAADAAMDGAPAEVSGLLIIEP